jgi:hypothetical protein
MALDGFSDIREPQAAEPPSTDEARELVHRLAKRIVQLQLGPVAIFFIESVRPLNFVGSQLLHFFAPFVRAFGRFPDYDLLARLLEDRRSIDLLLEAIEREEESREKEKAG